MARPESTHACHGNRFARQSAIQASRQHVVLGFLAVDVVAIPQVLVDAYAESDKQLVAPVPHAVVGRPAGEHAFLLLDDDVALDRWG